MKAATERRTQAERSAATQERLLDATLACLVELGWAGTSTTEVVRRAGVSRGAQVHHYPTKEALVLAAVEYLLERRVSEYEVAFENLPAEQRTVGAGFDLLCETSSGDTWEAWIEFAVAARSNPVLKEQYAEVSQRFRQRTRDLFAGMFPETDADPELARVGLMFAFCFVDGMSVARMCGADPASLDEVREVFKLLTAPYFPLSTPDPRGPQ